MAAGAGEASLARPIGEWDAFSVRSLHHLVDAALRAVTINCTRSYTTGNCQDERPFSPVKSAGRVRHIMEH